MRYGSLGEHACLTYFSIKILFWGHWIKYTLFYMHINKQSGFWVLLLDPPSRSMHSSSAAENVRGWCPQMYPHWALPSAPGNCPPQAYLWPMTRQWQNRKAPHPCLNLRHLKHHPAPDFPVESAKKSAASTTQVIDPLCPLMPPLHPTSSQVCPSHSKPSKMSPRK